MTRKVKKEVFLPVFPAIFPSRQLLFAPPPPFRPSKGGLPGCRYFLVNNSRHDRSTSESPDAKIFPFDPPPLSDCLKGSRTVALFPTTHKAAQRSPKVRVVNRFPFLPSFSSFFVHFEGRVHRGTSFPEHGVLSGWWGRMCWKVKARCWHSRQFTVCSRPSLLEPLTYICVTCDF
ncbi:hypothetical protein CEXT_415051 [Caerostris extrusa]|uniref:Uncharacterized protein n=1 Tax=Caerostris extrusa TaxID=172846 RepID=A0AAV4NV99_CAEEX|nr:hypothetical protein CEXT_415051 [Caerostris extrusa]